MYDIKYEESIVQALSTKYYLLNKQFLIYYGLEPCIVLSHFISKYEYFKEHKMLLDKCWFYTDYTQQREELGLTIIQIKNAKNLLQYDGILFSKLVIVKSKKYEWFYIDFDKMSELISTIIEENRNNSFNTIRINNERIALKLK